MAPHSKHATRTPPTRPAPPHPTPPRPSKRHATLADRKMIRRSQLVKHIMFSDNTRGLDQAARFATCPTSYLSGRNVIFQGNQSLDKTTLSFVSISEVGSYKVRARQTSKCLVLKLSRARGISTSTCEPLQVPLNTPSPTVSALVHCMPLPCIPSPR